jgi:D-alanyl-D-alanine carboxypeptidase
MKIKIIFRLFFLLCIVFLFLPGCKKKEAIDSNQYMVEQMKSVTDSIVANTYVPGIVALVVDHKRGIDWLYETGLSNIPAGLPMNTGFTFRIGSITKTFTGTVLLQLIDEGKLSLTDKLSKFYPEYPKSDSITIAMLCNMTSGIFDVLNWEPWTAAHNDPDKVWLPQEIVAEAFTYDFYFSPGTGWHYSNTNTFILGMLIEKLTGRSLKSEIDSRIIHPLQLNNTGILTSGKTLPGSHGRGYYNGTYKENEDYTEPYDLSLLWAAGSAYSNPMELQRYAEMLVGGGFLSDTLQRKRLNEMIALNPDNSYGLCLMRKGSFYGHTGALAGFTSSMYHSNDKNCTVVIYFNCKLYSPYTLIPDYLFKRIMDILYGSDF